MPAPSDFYTNPQRLSSKIKTDILAKYFKAWLDIMTKPQYNPSGQVGYVDLFAGAGKFTDEEGNDYPSTPLRIMDIVEKNPELTRNLWLRFNDAKPAYAEELRCNLEAHPAWPLIAERIQITSSTISTNTLHEYVPPFPALYFLDPFGYGGFSVSDLSRIVRGHGNDLLFFLNYNRFNQDLNHPDPKILAHPEALLGSNSYSRLQTSLKELAQQEVSKGKRQELITDHLWTQLEMGGQPYHYIIPFEFKFSDKDRTSHYVVFITKNKRARKIMREVMAGLRTDKAAGGFEFNPHSRPSGLFGNSFTLGDEMIALCKGETLSVDEVMLKHDLSYPRTTAIEKDYKEALKALRQADRIIVVKPDGKSVPTRYMPNDALVTFL